MANSFSTRLPPFFPATWWRACGTGETYRALETEIEQSRTHAAHLLQAVLKEAFSPASGKTGVHDGVHDEGFNSTAWKIASLLLEPKSTPEILPHLGYVRRTRNYESAIRTLLDENVIEMTLPNKPRSKNQKYRLTEKGRLLLKQRG